MQKFLLTAAAGMALGAMATTVALAQDDGLAEAIDAYAADYAVGLPDYVAETAAVCFVGVVEALAADDQALIAAGDDFIAGINDLVAEKPELPETLFPALDYCGATVGAGEVLLEWVAVAYADWEEDEREVLSRCLLAAVDDMEFDAKRGVIRFRFGDFNDAMGAMLRERPDLAGTFIEDAEACGVTFEEAELTPG